MMCSNFGKPGRRGRNEDREFLERGMKLDFRVKFLSKYPGIWCAEQDKRMKRKAKERRRRRWGERERERERATRGVRKEKKCK